MPDKTLRCSDCRSDFVLSEGEQEWLKEKDFTEPKRCKSCRKKRKARKEQGDSERPQTPESKARNLFHGT